MKYGVIALLSATLCCAATAPPDSSLRTGRAAFGDWRDDAPGVRRQITPADLPPPFATPSAGRPPTMVDRPASAQLQVPAGFSVQSFITGLTNPRVIRVAPNGDIFIAETQADRVRVLRAADGEPRPAEIQIYASGLDRPFGIAFYPLGADPRWVYIANNNSVVRFPYRNGDLSARGAAQIVVPRLSQSSEYHTTRDITFSADGKRMFVSVGSGSNDAEQVGRKAAAQIRQYEREHGLGAIWGEEARRANVLAFDPAGKPESKIFATGIRNCVGLALQPQTGDLWCSTNERDGLGDDLVPDYLTRVKQGAFYGWPWYYLGSNEDPSHKGARPDLAGKVAVPDVLLQSHSAPLEMTFYNGRQGAAAFPPSYLGDGFVALHGSWNRQQRTGYKIVRMILRRGVPTGEYQDFLTGFVVDEERVWGRPVGVTVARDGALLVTDDGSGTVWRVAYAGSAAGQPGSLGTQATQ